jgi:phosphoserine aminotransferase
VLPAMLSYKVQADNHSLYNTPPVFGVYMLRLVLQWLVQLGGLAAVAEMNDRKARLLYDELDRTPFWRPHADKDSRSAMNVTFRLPSEELERLFVRESTAVGFDGLKGHRSVGGLRASIYNAFPEAGVAALVDFMREFERKHG